MKTSADGLASGFALVLCAAAGMGANAAEHGWFSKGATVTFTGLSDSSSRSIKLTFVPYRVAVAANGGTVMYVNDSCTARASLRFTRGGTDKAVPGLATLMKGAPMRIDGLAVAPSGRRAAFVVRPCVRAAVAEASELGGVVYIVSLDDSRVVRLEGSVDSEGVPLGVAMDPRFSYDEKTLLVNFEGGFDVFDIGKGGSVFNSGEVRTLSQGWANGLGWVSGDCVAVKAGRDYKSADFEPPLVLNWRSRNVRALGELLALPSNRLLGLSEVHSEYGVRRAAAGGAEIVSLRDGLTRKRLPKEVGLVGIVAGAPATVGTDFCGQSR